MPEVSTNNQQIQTTNMFAALEGQDDEDQDNNQLIRVEDSNPAKSPTNANTTKKLNPSAAVFTPKSTGVGSTARKGKVHNVKENADLEGAQKETTAAWVNRTFNEKIVETNQSCQEIPSQATEIDAALKVTNGNERVQVEGRKMWTQQVEEDLEEGELPDGASGEKCKMSENLKDEDHGVEVMINVEQQMTLKLTNMDSQISFIVTFVYAKCDNIERIELWDSMYYLARDMTMPWLVAGDFNVIWDEEEKFGGLPVSMNEVNDFRHCVNTCNLTDLGFKGSIFTWWNGRAEDDCIFKRLDKCLANAEFQQMLPTIEVSHLSKTGSDHSPMLLKGSADEIPVKKAFRFLNFWTKHPSFQDVVKENWKLDCGRSIHHKIASLEEVVLVHETEFERNPSVQNRERLQKVQGELIRYLALEEEFWKQKAGMTLFQDGDRNTKFFHAQVNGRRKRLQLKRIQNNESNWIEDSNELAEEAVSFYQKQFHEDTVPTNFRILEHIPAMVENSQNIRLTQQPTTEEIKTAVMGLNGESAGGPDGFTGCFSILVGT
ncbi:PREDICTED: uncharacterized protein LOC109215172 [Nicotiana attenuata]|uniref:uncharacterized protein LOC109215172 n=1 Tax=Nicotiana attenuata TaxID=49451 RepID=UPI0009051426|nr:PREDICTED: uncharacterized protein LOC109215172 [Nicotiana attenuata]